MNNEKIKKELENVYKQVYELSDGNYCVSTKTSDEILDLNESRTELELINGLEGCFGLVDNKGNMIIEPKYLYPFIECNDNYQVMIPGEIQIIDGKRIMTEVQQGLINKKGEIIIPIKYSFMESIDSSDNYFRVLDTKLGKSGIIDKNNNIVVPFNYEYISSPSLELCLNTRYNIVYPKEVTQLAVLNNNLYGVYDVKENYEIIKSKYIKLKVIGYNRFLVDDTIIINEKEEKLKTYEEIYQENIAELTKLKDSSIIKYDNDLFIWQRKNYKDPDGYTIRYDNLYNIPCTCDGLISLRRMSYFALHTNYIESILDEYKSLRKYPIIYFPSEDGGINQTRADYKTFGDFIDYTLYDIKRFYELLNNLNKDEITVKEVLEYNSTLQEKIVLIKAYTLDNTFKFLTSFESFKDFIDWEFKNNDSLIELFVDKNNNYEVYDIETRSIIKSYRQCYIWTDNYYNNLKEIILKCNTIIDWSKKNV